MKINNNRRLSFPHGVSGNLVNDRDPRFRGDDKQRLLILIILVFVTCSSCSGQGNDAYLFRPGLPDKLSPFKSDLKTRAHFVSANGNSVLSETVEGVLEGDAWKYEVKSSFWDDNSPPRLTVEFQYGYDDSSRVTIAEVVLAVENRNGGELADQGSEAYDFSIDADDDGLANIDEFSVGTNPSISDTDGDGVKDGEDSFPMLASESADTDGDGIGNKQDDDRDGDGFTNDEELIFGTDPLAPDTDGDGYLDGADVCPLKIDPAQADYDGDEKGDACDDDSDADGLSDSIETSLGTNPFDSDSDGDGLGDGTERSIGTNPLLIDSDSDGVGDKIDSCPVVKNADQSDVDMDAVGDACDPDIDSDGILNDDDNCQSTKNPLQENEDGDLSGDECDNDADADGIPNASDNCPFTQNPAQIATDFDKDEIPIECDLDDKDKDVGDKKSAVFVDVSSGSDDNLGTIKSPVASINKALVCAKQRKLSVYVAAGEYGASSVWLYDSAKIFGGFENGDDPKVKFTSRSTRNDEQKYKTILTRSDSPTTLYISADSVTVSGFYIANDAQAFDSILPQMTVVITGDGVNLMKNVVLGNSNAFDAVAVSVSGKNSTISKNAISGGGADGLGWRCNAIFIKSDVAYVVNNVFVPCEARIATNVEMRESSVKFTNNTVDTRSGNASLGIAYGVIVNDSVVTFANNLIATSSANDQYPLVCIGKSPTYASKYINNLFAEFSNKGSTHIVTNCSGDVYDIGSFEMGDAIVSGNIVTDGDLISELFDDEYRLVGEDGVDDGIDVSGEEYGYVGDDYYGELRPKNGLYDIGAVEKE